jgi:CRP-like cAMP-binding protein
LSSLAEREQEQFLLSAESVSLSAGDILCQPESKIRYVYFPARSIISLLSITEDGTSVEVGMTGREGFVGVPVILGYGQMPSWAIATVGGEAIRIGSEELKRLLRHCEVMNSKLLNYTRSLITQISQTVVCNRRHQIEERLCSWLLMVQDRLGKSTLPLTQELIAGRLGTRRPGISMILKKLRKEGIVKASRGSVRVLDRERLKNAACECYAVVRFEDAQNETR